jgi:hypothetical protein
MSGTEVLQVEYINKPTEFLTLSAVNIIFTLTRSALTHSTLTHSTLPAFFIFGLLSSTYFQDTRISVTSENDGSNWL